FPELFVLAPPPVRGVSLVVYDVRFQHSLASNHVSLVISPDRSHEKASDIADIWENVFTDAVPAAIIFLLTGLTLSTHKIIKRIARHGGVCGFIAYKPLCIEVLIY